MLASGYIFCTFYSHANMLTCANCPLAFHMHACLSSLVARFDPKLSFRPTQTGPPCSTWPTRFWVDSTHSQPKAFSKQITIHCRHSSSTVHGNSLVARLCHSPNFSTNNHHLPFIDNSLAVHNSSSPTQLPAFHDSFPTSNHPSLTRARCHSLAIEPSSGCHHHTSFAAFTTLEYYPFQAHNRFFYTCYIGSHQLHPTVLMIELIVSFLCLPHHIIFFFKKKPFIFQTQYYTLSFGEVLEYFILLSRFIIFII